jgi:phage tail-like protein
MSKRIDPFPAYNFAVTLMDASSAVATVSIAIGVEPQAGFAECSGLEMQLAVDEYKQGGENGTVRKFPARISWPNLKLRRGVSKDNALWLWCQDFMYARGKRRDGLITLRNERHEPVRIWRFVRGLPVKWSGPALNAMQNGLAFEEIEIAHEGLQLVSENGGKIAEVTANIVGALKSL